MWLYDGNIYESRNKKLTSKHRKLIYYHKGTTKFVSRKYSNYTCKKLCLLLSTTGKKIDLHECKQNNV